MWRARAREEEDGVRDVVAVGDPSGGYPRKHGRLVEPAGPQVLKHPFGRDMARRDRIDAQPMSSPFDRHRPGEAVERRLRR